MSATMIKEFRLPDLGEGLTESEILSWKVGVGDTVSLNQVIAEVETAKAVVELPSPFAGVIKELHEQPGSVVEVGKPIVSFEVADDAGGSPSVPSGTVPSGTVRTGAMPTGAGSAGSGEAAVETPKREPNLVGYGAVVEGSGRPTRRARNFAPVAGPAETKPAVVEPVDTRPVDTSAAERPRSTPPVRKLAKDLGVDLVQIRGTGPGGLITREDVQGFAGQVEEAATPLAGQVSAAATAAGERETRTPIKGVRKHTAAAMVQSAFTAPHATEFLTVDVTPSLELLAKLKDSRAFAGIKLTPLTLAAKAVLIALRRQPALNSRWDEEHQEIVTFHYVNLGIAAATPRGLTVPNIKDADALQLPELAQALAELAPLPTLPAAPSPSPTSVSSASTPAPPSSTRGRRRSLALGRSAPCRGNTGVRWRCARCSR